MQRKVEDVLCYLKSGKTTHIIMKGMLLACNQNRKAEENKDGLLTLDKVDCQKCKRLSLYKELKEAKPEEKQKSKQKSKPKKEAKPKKEKKSEPEPKPEEKQVEEKQVEEKQVEEKQVEEKPDNQKTLSEEDKAGIKELRELQTILGQAVEFNYGQFMGRLKSNFKFEIYHVLSKTTMFDNVSPRVIGNCLLMLNSLRVHWSGCGTPGSNFISTMRKAFETGYVTSEIDSSIVISDFIPEKKRLPSKKAIKKLPTRKKKGRKVKTTPLPKSLPKRKKSKQLPKRKKR